MKAKIVATSRGDGSEDGGLRNEARNSEKNLKMQSRKVVNTRKG
jgi:hypothetical protein